MEKSNKLRIRMLSAATSVSGQGVGSAYLEQVALVKEQSDLFEVLGNNDKGYCPIHHVHTVNPSYRFRMNKRHINIIYVHFIPTTLDGSVKLPKPIFSIFKKYVVSMYRKADEIVVVNPVFKKPLIELGMKEENITYIPNYVSKDSFFKVSEERRAEIRKEYGIKDDAFVVLGCGQVQTRKGVVDYVEVAKKNPDIEFVWAGGFSFGAITDGYKELKAIMENPPKNVHFTGIIDRNKMNDVFNMADILFMPSFNELFPMSILEAVNSSKPVLLRDLDLYKDILFGDYVKGTNVEEFSNQVRKLKEDKAYYEQYSKKADEIASFYSKEHVSKLWREYYQRIYDKWKGIKKIKK